MVTASGTPGVDADGDGVDDNTGEILVIGTPIKGWSRPTSRRS
jgi:hypothetical protein